MITDDSLIFFLSILSPFLIGLTILIRCLIDNGSLREWLLIFSLLPGTGIAITSVFYYYYFYYFRPLVSSNIYFIFELALGLILLVGIVLWIRRQGKAIQFPKPRIEISHKNKKSVLLSVLTLIVFIVFIANFLEDWYAETLINPYGHWDAWAIWNLRARFIFSEEYWMNGFSQLIHWSHPDYPLLLPSFIAREWAFLDRLSPFISAIVGLVFLISVVFTVVFGVGYIHGLSLGTFSGLFALGVVTYSLKYLQYADMPLAFYFLAANLSLYISQTKHPDDQRYLFLTGMFTGAALWTKNEGYAFLIAIVITEIIYSLISNKHFIAIINRWFSITVGCLPFIITRIIFDVSLAPNNDLISGTTLSEIIKQIVDPARIQLIGNHFLRLIIDPWALQVPMFVLLGIYIFLVGIEKKPSFQSGHIFLGIRIGLIALIYFGEYFITPRPLDWHLNSSADRLFLQLLPSFIVFIFLTAKNPFSLESTST